MMMGRRGRSRGVVGHRRRRRRPRVRSRTLTGVIIAFRSASSVRVISLATIFPTLNAAWWRRISVTELREHGAGRKSGGTADIGEVLGVKGRRGRRRVRKRRGVVGRRVRRRGGSGSCPSASLACARRGESRALARSDLTLFQRLNLAAIRVFFQPCCTSQTPRSLSISP